MPDLRVTFAQFSGIHIDIPQEIYSKCNTLVSILTLSNSNTVELSTVTPTVMNKVLFLLACGMPKYEIKPEMLPELVEIWKAADFLECVTLLDAVTTAIAEEVQKMKSAEQIREFFGHPDDINAEERDRILYENVWKMNADDLLFGQASPTPTFTPGGRT